MNKYQHALELDTIGAPTPMTVEAKTIPGTSADRFTWVEVSRSNENQETYEIRTKLS